MKPFLYALLLAASLPLSARADRLPLPADTPPAYAAECGSCHLAFPPALLAAADWRRVMAGLDRHYGDNAALDADTARVIGDFLTRHGGDADRYAHAGTPPRLTATAWFQRKHRKVPSHLWQDTRVRSAANCAACHPQAELGRYGEHDIALPELRRRKEH